MTEDVAKYLIEQGISAREILFWNAAEYAAQYAFYLALAYVFLHGLKELKK